MNSSQTHDNAAPSAPGTPETPGTDDKPTQTLSDDELMALLKRLAVRGDPQHRHIGLAQVREAMRYVAPINDDVGRVLARSLKAWPTDPMADAREIRNLITQPVPAGHFSLSDELQGLLRAAGRRGVGGFVRYRAHPLGTRARAAWFQTIFAAVEGAAPGQHSAARELARNLALQLTDSQRRAASYALLSGPLGSGARQAARAVAQSLAPAGYQLLEIEMSGIRCDEEAAEIDGGQPYWRGSRPGKVTSAVHAHPKTVVVLHDLDKTLPAAQASLLPALRDGYMMDNYGLDELTEQQRRESTGRKPTKVNMQQAIFLATVSVGHELWLHPDMAELLDGHKADLRDARQTVVHAMRDGQRVHRGRELPTFDLGTLNQLERQLVLFKPLRWQVLLQRAEQAVAEACLRASQRLGLPVTTAPGNEAALALALLASQGGQVELDKLSGEQAETALFTTLVEALIDAELDQDLAHSLTTKPAVARATLLMDPADQQQLTTLLQPLGDEPNRHLQRRRLTLRYDISATHGPDGWSVRLSKPCLVQLKDTADYTGDTALAAVVPKVSFADVAGHSQAKTYLKEVIDLYARADQLRAKGLDLPRGAVLHGPPGTGKTLLAQAMAAEAGMAFISSSGADLLNPERVKETFALARKNAPSVLFIDEADALGKRGQGSGLHDAAINRVLAAIQGFDQRAPVYILAATNRPQLLDGALTRAGRLDHAIFVGPLDREGREPLVRLLMEQLAAHQQGDQACSERLLSFSYGMTGADLRQVLREVALRGLKLPPGEHPTPDDVIEALTAHKYGKKNDARRRTQMRESAAFHEAGHAVHHWHRRPDVPIEQVTITARGHAEGFMALNPEEVAGTDDTAELVRHQIGTLLSGRLAEVLHLGAARGASGGAADDLAQARTLAFVAVAHKGLDSQLGLLSLRATDDEDRALMPDQLKQEVWGRVRVWLAEAEAEARAVLQQHWPVVQALAAELMACDYVPGARVAALMAQHAPAADPSAPTPTDLPLR